MKKYKLYNLAVKFEKLASVYNMTTYHGTDAKNLSNIAIEGLIPQRPFGYESKNIYFTNDIETAAYYASGGHRASGYPCVLEIVLSGNRRIKQLSEDPLDQPYLAGGEFAEPDDYSQATEDLYTLEHKVEEVIGQRVRGFVDEVEKLDGVNIYKQILGLARANSLDIQLIKRKIMQLIPPGWGTDSFEIQDDGTIKLTQEYYNARHQMTYPKQIPGKAIKAVWAPEDRVRPLFKQLATERKAFGYKLLSGDLGNLKDELRQVSDKAYRASSEELLDIIENLKQEDVHGILGDLSELEEAAKNGDGEQFQTITDFMMAEETEFGTTAKEQTWLRFDLGKIGLGLDRVIDLYL